MKNDEPVNDLGPYEGPPEGWPPARATIYYNQEPDDLSISYMERRDNTISQDAAAVMSDPDVQKQFAEYQASPAGRSDRLKELWGNTEKGKQEFEKIMMDQGWSPPEKVKQEIQAQYGGVQQPWVDPITAFSGSFGAGAILSKTIGKPLISGILNALADYPVGFASELVAEKVPALALPFNLAFGVTSGIFAQNKLEDAIVKSLTRRKIPITDKTVQEVFENLQTHMKDAIANERGSISGKPPSPGEPEAVSKPILSEMNQEIINNFAKEVQGNVSSQLKRMTPGKKKVFFDIAPTPEAKATRFFQAETVDLPEKAININFRNIESPEDIKAVIYQTSKAYEDEIQVSRRGIISNEETAKLADNLGMDVNQLLKRRQGQALNAEQAFAARNLLVSSAENMREAAQRAISPDASELDKFEFRKLLNLHFAIQSEVSGMTAEAGRALQQFRMKAASQEGMIAEIKNSMAGLQSLERSGTTEDLAATILTLDSLGKVSRIVSKFNKSGATDMLIEFWINSILSGPMTHAVNMTSNTLTALWQIPERALAAGIGKVLPGEAEIGAAEAFHLIAGIKGGFEDGFRLIAKTAEMAQDQGLIPALSQLTKSYTGTGGKIEHGAAITGANMLQTPVGKMADKIGMGGQLARAADIIGETVRIPGTALQFEDAIFKGIGYRMELNARAFRMARAEGLEGRALSDRVASLVNDPPDELVKVSKDFANYMTYTNQLGDVGRKFQSLLSSHPAFKFIVPFVKTPTNIFKFFGERTPLALLSKSIRDDIMSGGAVRDLALSKMALGSTIMALVGWQTLEGNITGGGPKDKALNDTWRRTGRQPYSFKLGDQYLSYARFEPLGTLVGVTADIAEIYSQYQTGAIDDDNDLLYSGLTAISKNVANKTFLQGITNFIEAQADPERYLPSYMSRMATSFIPNVVGQVNSFEVDPVFRQTRGLIDAAKAKIPGLSSSLPPRRNLWGEPIVREGGGIPGIPDLVNPLFKSSDKNSPIDEEMKKNNIGVSPVSKWINGVELLPAEYDRYVELAGNAAKNPSTGLGLKDALNELIGNPKYQALTEGKEGGKAEIIKKYIEIYRDAAKGQMFQEFPGLRESIKTHMIEKETKKRGGAPTFQ